MRRELVPILRSLPELRDRAEELWHGGRILCGSIAQRYQVQKRLQRVFWRHATQERGAELLRSRNWRELEQLTVAHLPLLGIRTCFVCTFEPGGESRLRIALDSGRRLEPSDYPTFAKEQMLPAELIAQPNRRSLIAESLFDEERAIGYALFEVGQDEPEVYSLLRDYFTGALRGINT
jgi:hypothetical protein